MATKTAAKKKTTTRKSPAKRASSRSELPIGLYKENHPENHIATGKYKFFFVVFGILMVVFAALAVQLFVFSSNLLDEYQKTVECSNDSSCSKHVVNTSVNEDATTDSDEKE